MEKRIIIPECRPLYAMQKCFGPTTGPLTIPTRAPVNVIRLLLLQTGAEAVTIYEVPFKGATPVQLTLDNYDLPYDQIIGAPAAEAVEVVDAVAENVVPSEPVMPVIVTAKEEEKEAPAEPVVEEDNKEQVVETAEEVKTETVVEEVAESVEVKDEVEVIVEKPEETVSVSAPVADTNNQQQQSNPYAGMSKAERKAARRAEYLARQAAEKTEEPAVNAEVEAITAAIKASEDDTAE